MLKWPPEVSDRTDVTRIIAAQEAHVDDRDYTVRAIYQSQGIKVAPKKPKTPESKIDRILAWGRARKRGPTANAES